jgi:hypothetical protein
MGYPAKDKEIAKRPEANKGGREEEEKRFGQTTELTALGRLRNRKRWPMAATGPSQRPTFKPALRSWVAAANEISPVCWVKKTNQYFSILYSICLL